MKKLLTTALIPLFFSGFVFAAGYPAGADTAGSKDTVTTTDKKDTDAASDKMAGHDDKMKAKKHGKKKHKKASSMHDDSGMMKSGK